jgi:hypothetical protein
VAVPRDIENVMLVSVFSNLPFGLARKCVMFRFLIADAFISVQRISRPTAMKNLCMDARMRQAHS